MFLFGITKSAEVNQSQFGDSGLRLHHVSCTGWSLTYGASPASLIREHDGVISVTERWSGAAAVPGRLRVSVNAVPKGDGYEVDIVREVDSAKHVYVAEHGGGIIITDRISLLRKAGFTVRIDESVLPEVMLYRFAMAPRTLFKGVRQLRVGEHLRVRVSPGAVESEIVEIFTPRAADTCPDDIVDRLVAALRLAHADYGIEPSRFGTMLSGGLDSSILTVIAREMFGNSRTYSCSYGIESEAADTELSYARSAAEWIGTRHHVHTPTRAQFLHGILDSALASEQCALHLQTGLLASVLKHELASAGVKVWTCGEGADGAFGGRVQRMALWLQDRAFTRSLLGTSVAKSLLSFASSHTNRGGLLADVAGRRVGDGTPVDDPRNILWSSAIFGDRKWVHSRMKGETLACRMECMSAFATENQIDQLLYVNLHGEVAETQAVWAAISEAVGIEAVFPYTNPRFVSEAANIPWPTRLATPKGLLRAAAAKLGVDRRIIERPKSSFDVRPEFYGPQGSILEPLVRLAAPAFGPELMSELRSTNVFKAQMLYTSISLGILRRHFESGDSAATLHEELDRHLGDNR